MASESYPRPGLNSGSVTEVQYEQLMATASADGIIGHPADPSPVFADTTAIRSVKVRANIRALVRASVYESGPTDITLPQLAANTSGQPRLDLVVLRLNRADFTVVPAVKQGVPGANPIAPTPDRNTSTTGVYELPIAEVRVEHNASNLALSDVTTRGWYVNADGGIRCTATSMPDQDAGRLAFDVTYGLRVSAGAKWLYGVEDWDSTSLPLENGWGGTINRLHRRNGWVHMAVTPQRTGSDIAANANVLLGVLPAGYRPPYDFEHTGFATSTSSPILMLIKQTGQVYITVFGGLSKNRYINFASHAFPAA